jgi:hypothetical protein
VLTPLLQVLHVSASARQDILASFDEKGLEDIFSKVEVFVATFPKDENIITGSIELLACILRAVEEGVVFFLSHTRKIHSNDLYLLARGYDQIYTE